MNLFNILKQQVKAAIKAELAHAPEIRKCIDWRFVIKVGTSDYIVGKTAENTCYYQGPLDHELIPCFPEQLVDKIDEWNEPQYASYSIFRKSDKKVVGTADLETCLSRLPKTFQDGLYIVGNKKNGSSERLYKMKKGLKGMRWVQLKKETEQ